MSNPPRIVETWLSRRPSPGAWIWALFFALLICGSGLIGEWPAASVQSVFVDHHFLRLWTALVAHANLEHLLSNMSLFIPLSALLIGYFGLGLFLLGLLVVGPLIQGLTLLTMSSAVTLLGISGLVHWVGAVWLTLFVLIETRKSLRRRLAVALFLALMLFAPETFRPEISYVSHAVGFLLGILSGLVYYAVHRRQILAAEIFLDEDMEP